MKKIIFYLVVLIALKSYLWEVEGSRLNDHKNESLNLQGDCTCIPYYRCLDNETIEYMKPGDISQEDENVAYNECSELYEVCCRHPQNTDEPKCGKRNHNEILGMTITDRIMTTYTSILGASEFGAWPWQAALLQVVEYGFLFNGGATLIDERHVLTVAHRVQKFLDNPHLKLVIRLGEWETDKDNEPLLHENYNVTKIIIHPDFSRNDISNDIAILKLDKDVIFKPHIDTVCLPKPDDNFEGHICTVTGWGTDNYSGGRYSTVLNEVNLPVISNVQCQDMLRRTRLGKKFKLHESFMCAGGNEGEDACKGDGGGPLVCLNSDNTYTLAGLVSWGIGCGTAEVPGVYVNVKMFTNWIAAITGKNTSEYWSTQ